MPLSEELANTARTEPELSVRLNEINLLLNTIEQNNRRLGEVLVRLRGPEVPLPAPPGPSEPIVKEVPTHMAQLARVMGRIEDLGEYCRCLTSELGSYV